MKNITQWEHFKRNYLAIMIFFIGLGVLAIFTAEPDIWWMPIPFFLIAFIIIPIGNYFSWKSKS